MKNVFSSFVRSLPLAVIIIVIGCLAVHFFFQDPQKLDVTLFVLGAIPVVLFLPSVCGQSKSGAIHTPKVIFRKVDNLERKDNKEAESIFPALTYVIAGVLTWLYGWVVY
jgi:dolichol kinase